MVAPHPGIQILNDRLTKQVLGTLAGSTVILINGNYNGLTSGFLIKKLNYNYALIDAPADDSQAVLVGFARESLNVTEIKTRLETVFINPEDPSNANHQADARGIFWETLRILNGRAPLAHGLVSLGGGKGIPVPEANGWQGFCYNLDTAALVTGSGISMYNIWYGVWLSS